MRGENRGYSLRVYIGRQLITLLLFLIHISQKQIDNQPIILDGITDVYASEFIFISTPLGIYTFDRESETWGRISHTSGLPGGQVSIIGLDEGILWVATSEGLASADIRINDWQTYELDGNVRGLTFDEEYVWVGGDFGVKRFDKYGETWEDVSSAKVNDVFSEKNYVWFATESGVLRYDRNYENMEDAPNAPRYPYSCIINTPARIWFISHHHHVGYHKSTEDWSQYDGFKVDDYSNLGDSLFAVSNGRVLLYEPRSDNWTSFRDIKDLQYVNGVFAGAEKMLCATDGGLVTYDWSEGNTITYSRRNGLQTDSLIDVYQETRFIFVVNRHGIEYLDTETAIWRVEELRPLESRREQILYLDDAGAHARLGADTDIRVAGRAYYSQSFTQSNSHVTRTDRENINLRLTGQHSSKRFFSLYYDDTDREQLMYGCGYRGLDTDLLYRWNGGFLTSEYFEFDLIPQFSTYGGNAKLRQKAYDVDIQGGQLKSQPRSNFFTGRSVEKRLLLLDTDYRKNTFYSIYDAPQPVRKGADTVFVDDRLSSTNEIDTRNGFTVAGITGDFNPLMNGIDYFIEYKTGIIHFLSSRADSDIVVLSLNGEEIVIQSDLVRGHSLENVYSVGPKVIPRSFSLSITDTLGRSHPLREFGLDNDGDSRVDQEFINYDLGYLSFPQPRPFPDEVYDDTVHIYTMDIQFLSQSIFYYLSFTPIVKNSEQVYVDGEIMMSGADYLIDYTSGILLFLKEDVISDFSEIDVQYSSVERDEGTIFYSAQPKIGIGNSIHVAPGVSLIEDRSIFHVSARLQQEFDRRKSIWFVPQVAIDGEKAWAHDHSLIANYGILSLNGQFREYSENFEGYGAHERKYGRLQRSAALLARIEPISHLRLDGQLKREYQVDSLEMRRIAQHTYGRIHYLNPRFPNGYILLGSDRLPDYEKKRLKVSANYDFQIWDSEVKLNSILRNIVVELNGGGRNRVREYIFDTHFSLPFSVHGGVHFRFNTLYANGEAEKEEKEIRGTLNVDVVPGLYYTGDYNLQTTAFFVDRSLDLYLKHQSYSNLNVAPGRWLRPLSVVNLSLGLTGNFDEYIQNLPVRSRRPSLLISPIEDVPISSLTNTNSYYATIQFTPTSNISIWAKRTLNRSGVAYYAIPDLRPILKDELRIEYEPRSLGIFIASLDLRTNRRYPAQTFQNVYFEWSLPWSAFMRTKLTTNYRLDENTYGSLSTQSSELKGNVQALFRFDSKSFLTLDLGSTRQEDYAHTIRHSITPGVGLNLFLFGSLYMQLDHQSTFTLGNAAIHTLSTRIAAQF